ncbi:MAG: tetratricopeptide repeat protein [Alphaproteobacteria bacterium]|nr:tetratricopeptide repeat protein [Alphaproteobacteria bacterium]
MRVIARNSSFAYKGQALDLRRIAEELNVRYVLEGSVRRGGNRLRITAQLIDADEGSHLWAERYDRLVDDLFDIQDEITKEIVTALRVKLTDGEEARVWARGTNNVDAWQYGVRATELAIDFTPSGNLEARELAEKATELDPEYAHAWAMLGITYWMDGRLGHTGDADAKFAHAAELADRAMALDDSVSWAIGLGALIAAPLGRYDEGVEIARRGVELNPGNADVRVSLAYPLMHAGHFSEAADHFRAAISLNPFPPNNYRYGLARTLMFLDEFDEALSLLDENLDLMSSNTIIWLFRAYIYGQIGREADARRAIDMVRQFSPDMRLSHMPGLLTINDEAATKRFSDGLRKAGLPED